LSLFNRQNFQSLTLDAFAPRPFESCNKGLLAIAGTESEMAKSDA